MKEQKLEIQELVTKSLADVGAVATKQAVQMLAEREANKRADALVNVWDKLQSLMRDMRKHKPDNVQINPENGDIASNTYSMGAWKAKTELQQKIDKHIAAINKATTNGDWSDVYKLSGGKASDPAPTTEEVE